METLEESKFNIHYVKQHKIDLKELEKNYQQNPEDIDHEYNPFHINNLQNYNPIYSLFFDLTEKSFNKIALNHKFHFINMNTVMHSETKEELNQPVFIKYSPLIDPIRYMAGKYKDDMDKLQLLPNPFSNQDTFPKINYYNNTSYTDNFFSFLSSKILHQHNFTNGIDYYGSFLGVQKKFKTNISDDLDYLNSSDYFSEKVNKLFTVSINEEKTGFLNFGSRGNKKKLQIEDTDECPIIDDLDELDLEIINENDNNIESDELIYEKENKLNVSDTSSSDSSNNSETNYSDDDKSNEGSQTEDEDEDQDEDEENWGTESDDSTDYTDSDDNQYSFINNFPLQLICLEKCDGTLDELFERNEVGIDNGAAYLMQIIMTLIAYQKVFHFTHNDLHTNNIMYIQTDKKFLYYRFENKVYKVPTYGKIFKIIDFGRSIYKFNGHLFFSDSFASGGDGATQYNCEPYMNENKPRIEPNYSFDLSRLGASIYDFIIDNDKHPERFDELQKTIYRWCLDDNDKNILYKHDGRERYPNFKLYKMIARTVHKHTPQDQLNFPLFQQFLVKKDTIDNIMDIDAMPRYI
uniref:Protein kinase domain-containing protein n=1 Tax=viral metagenome TaxID=1070528 RepID=A0A6C0JR64_9ZZZZ